MKLYSIWRHCRYSKPSIVILAFNPLKVLERPEQGQPNNFKEDYENYDSLSVSQKLDLAFRQDAYGRKFFFIILKKIPTIRNFLNFRNSIFPFGGFKKKFIYEI